MKGRLLLVAYPLLPVSRESAGGAEQILCTLERELVARGWQTTVAAAQGSCVSGDLLATVEAADGRLLSDAGLEELRRRHEAKVLEAWREGAFDALLDHSGHFFRRAGELQGPLLATLHLPRALYGAEVEESFRHPAPNLRFHCVSQSQEREFLDLPQRLPVVPNGIDLEGFARGERRGEYLLWLGRVCPEKAPHLAIEVARRAGMPLVLAGQVYPFPWHMRYWEERLRPEIDGEQVRWIERPGFVLKRQLLAEARGLLVTSQVPETTSLVALEAMASGTPVVALRRGALAEVVAPETGFLVDGVDGMVEACGRLETIRASACCQRVAHNFSSWAMASGYEQRLSGLMAEVSFDTSLR